MKSRPRGNKLLDQGYTFTEEQKSDPRMTLKYPQNTRCLLLAEKRKKKKLSAYPHMDHQRYIWGA